jgi:CRP/FNR family transcriptional regulator, cyclic AMP receptor protein
MQAFTKTYKTGAHLFHENDHSRELYIIQSGTVRVYRKIGSREADLARLSKGAVLGEMALIDGKPRSASAVAHDDTTVIMIDADTFHKRISGVPAWFLSMIRTTSEKIRKANSRLEAIQSRGHCLHVILALQYYFLRYGVTTSSKGDGATDTGAQKTLEVSQTASQLIQLLSVSHQCIMQMLSCLQKKGVIDIRDGRIALCDQAKLDGCCDYLRLLFRKAFDKMGEMSGRASGLILALQETVAPALFASSEKGVEIAAADMAAACAKGGEEKSCLESIAELKELGVLSFTKGAPAQADTAPLAGYQFFIQDPAVYRKFLLYCTYKDMVPSL